MNKKCPNCRLVNYANAEKCVRCEADLCDNVTTVAAGVGRRRSIIVRIVVCYAVCVAMVLGFYLSLIASSKSLSTDQVITVQRAIAIIDERGFSTEAMFLKSFTVYRTSDNWLNTLVAKENAYAATNFPFEIMTLYVDFFTYPADDTERAAILLHEARHLQGGDEKDAYQFVWINRRKLGWTRETHFNSPVWKNVRKQTREYVPSLFTCEGNDFNDCSE